MAQNFRSCLKFIIGLSRVDCNCFQAGRPTDFQTSFSGFYLDDPKDGVSLLNSIELASDCGEGGIWEMMQKARTIALDTLENDLLSAFSEAQRAKIPSFSGDIGERNFGASLLLTEQVVGVQLEAVNLKGAVLTLEEIGLCIDRTANTQVFIVSSEDLNNPITSLTVPTVAGELSFASFPTPVELPLYSENCNEELKYYVVWQRGTAQPKSNKFSCGCKGRKGIKDWQKFVKVNGVEAPLLTDLNDGRTSSKGNGLVLVAAGDCSGLNWVCERFEERVFSQTNDLAAWYRVLAKLTQYKAAEMLISMILESGRINRYTLLNGENLAQQRAYLEAQYFNYVGTVKHTPRKGELYTGRLRWLAENIPANVTDCLKCKSGGFKKASILV